MAEPYCALVTVVHRCLHARWSIRRCSVLQQELPVDRRRGPGEPRQAKDNGNQTEAFPCRRAFSKEVGRDLILGSGNVRVKRLTLFSGVAGDELPAHLSLPPVDKNAVPCRKSKIAIYCGPAIL
jgi:hypothetical protein